MYACAQNTHVLAVLFNQQTVKKGRQVYARLQTPAVRFRAADKSGMAHGVLAEGRQVSQRATDGGAGRLLLHQQDRGSQGPEERAQLADIAEAVNSTTVDDKARAKTRQATGQRPKSSTITPRSRQRRRRSWRRCAGQGQELLGGGGRPGPEDPGAPGAGAAQAQQGSQRSEKKNEKGKKQMPLFALAWPDVQLWAQAAQAGVPAVAAESGERGAELSWG
jgi:hypothetical protein